VAHKLIACVNFAFSLEKVENPVLLNWQKTGDFHSVVIWISSEIGFLSLSLQAIHSVTYNVFKQYIE
jgi:hypothetical protein